MWLPILDITGELEALDLNAELELLEIEAGRAVLDAELVVLEADFWSTAPRGLEEAVANLHDPVEPEAAELLVPAEAPVPEPSFPEPPVPEPAEPPGPEPSEAAPLTLFEPPAEPAMPEAEAAVPAPEPEPVSPPEAVALAEASPSRAERRHAAHRRDVRNRVLGTALVVALLGALATVTPSVVGASVPQRHISVTLDGHTVNRTVRLATVGEVLTHVGIVIHPGDRVVPASATELREDMQIVVLRSFPLEVDVDGALSSVRTTARTREGLRRELGLDRALVARGPVELAAGATIAFRTPHDVTVNVDGRTIDAPRTAALDVAGLLRDQGIAVGPRDEVLPALGTRLANGLQVHVYRLADGQVAERVTVPFTTETHEDASLRVGQTRMIRPGVNGERRDLFKVTTRDDGTVVSRTQVGSEVVSAPVSQIMAKGTQPIPPSATGSATWYGTGPGPGTCAHLRLAFGTVVTITNRDTGAVAQCRVQDRGPETWTGHIIDLAPDVFRRLAPLSQGILPNVALSY